MTTRAASEGKLAGLHEKIATVMGNALDVIDASQERYLKDEESVEPPPQASPQLLSVITKFLSDNNITCAPEESAGMSELERKLEERKAKRRTVGKVVHDVEFG